MFKKYSILASILILCFCLLHAENKPKDGNKIMLTWQRDPCTTMTIQWISSNKDKGNNVYFHSKEEVKWQLVQATSNAFPQLPYLVHRVELTQLKPNCMYYFKINNDNQQYKFCTMPATPTRPIRFAIGGDLYHDTIDLVEETNRQAVKANPDFILLGGDLAYSCSTKNNNHENAQRWIDLLKAWHDTMQTSDGRFIPIVSAIGNHEVKGGYDQTPAQAACFYSIFAMPEKQGYNVLDFGKFMTIVILDSGHTHPVGGTQADWLRKTLRERKQVTHKFAIYHVPAYPSFRSKNDNSSPLVRQHWVPLFEKYGLQVAFEHHDHTYKRTFPLKKGKKDSAGVVYLGDGAWGVAEPRKPKSPKKTLYLAETFSKRHFILATVDGQASSFQAIDSSGKVIDKYEIRVAPQPARQKVEAAAQAA